MMARVHLVCRRRGGRVAARGGAGQPAMPVIGFLNTDFSSGLRAAVTFKGAKPADLPARAGS
jgi:hypothetical protein